MSIEFLRDDLEGFEKRRKSQHAAAVASAASLWADLRTGRVPSYFLQEALAPRTPAVLRAIAANYPYIIRMSEGMTASDFPYLTGDVLDRMLLGAYRAYPSPWRQFVKISRLRDFRTVDRLYVNGLEGQQEKVAEGAEFTRGKLSEGKYSYRPYKYVKGAQISFEALRNDDLGAFEDIPNRLGRGAARTKAKSVTELYVDANGPHASLYTGGNANIVTSNPALSVTALGTAWQVLNALKDADGEPIAVEAAVLVVPPALEVTANNILNAIQIFMTNTGGASGQELQVANWLAGRLSLAVDPYIPIVASSTNTNTSWFLFAATSVGRPALEVGELIGFEEPVLYQKQANTVRIGGGLDQMAGDWDTMSQEYKSVTAWGATRLDPKATVASNGSGS